MERLKPLNAGAREDVFIKQTLPGIPRRCGWAAPQPLPNRGRRHHSEFIVFAKLMTRCYAIPRREVG